MESGVIDLVHQLLKAQGVQHRQFARHRERTAATHHGDAAEERVASLPRGMAKHRRLPGAGMQHPAQHLESGGLAGAVRADEADHFALPHLERDGAHRLHRAIFLPE